MSLDVNAKPFSDEDFLISHYDDYYADALNAADSERFRRLVQEPQNQQLVDDVKRAVGMFQLGLQSYFLSEDQRVGLNDLVEDAEVRRTREAKKIEQLSKWESLVDFRRRLVIILLVVGLIFSVIYYFTPEKKPQFDALQTLAYESLAMEEKAVPAFDFPSHDPSDIAAFLAAYKGLDFDPAPLKDVPSEWRPDGATVIDYETAKIVAVQYTSQAKKDRFFYYNFRGSVHDLPKAPAFDENGKDFYAFSSDQYNVICWQLAKDVVGMIVGRRSAKDLAVIGRSTGQ